MNFRPVPTVLPCIALLAAQLASGAAHTLVKTFDPQSGLTLELAERTAMPHYWWPSTLLNYRVTFPGAPVTAGRLCLRNEATGAAVPFQLSDIRQAGQGLESATVSFFSDLPSGAKRRFHLSTGPGCAGPAAPAAVKESTQPHAIVLDNGKFRFKLPASQTVTAQAPGPVMGVAWQDAWVGGGGIVSPKRRVLNIETSRLEQGPLFTVYRVTYHFEGGASYIATMRAVKDYDFLQLKEEVRGLPREEGVYWDAAWKNFAPTHRHAPNHPYLSGSPTPGVRPYDTIPWEKIDEAFVNTQHGVSPGISATGELPFRLGLYQPWGAYIILNSSCFWDQRTSQSLGVFIDQAIDWQDGEYAIWSASNTQQLRYLYQDGTLRWNWPLVTGTRSTGIAVYSHARDVEAVDRIAKLANTEPDEDGIRYKVRLFPASHTQFLQNRYGTASLDSVKDWVLTDTTGPPTSQAAFPEGKIKTPRALLQTILGSELATGMLTAGTRQNAGYSPVPARNMYEQFTDGLYRLWPQLTARQRERVVAWLLMLAYGAAGEDWMPLHPMLAGHPNFLSDVKSIPALAAFLFPRHPMAAEWSDLFEKSIDLNTRYHTRPAVASWDSAGGRWTENLGTYIWAFLRPLTRGEYALRQYGDGKNRLANPQIAQIGAWALNALSAPFDGEDLEYYRDAKGVIPPHYWGVVTKENGPRRLHPPQGAHSARRMPPRTLWWIGDSLRYHQPLLAESLMWASKPTDDDSEHRRGEVDPWQRMFATAGNSGTNPHLQTSKFTGYGIVMRAAVDTPQETSVHLQQIDDGPNYRWGIAGQGGAGVLYYYAGGKSYSHNGREDVGDRPAHDTDFATNFGVWKDGRFKSIGRNTLERPLHDLGALQYAELVPRRGPDAYSWPEYQGRSVMLVGADYLVVYDDVFNDAVSGRFSWMTHIKESLPEIHMVKGGVRERQRKLVQVQTDEIKGVWYDGLGDAMAVVSHKGGLKVEARPFGALVTSPQSFDYIFRDPDGIRFDQSGIAFTGKAGVVRKLASGAWEMAVFDGSRIAAGGATLSLSGAGLGISLRLRAPGELEGIYSGAEGGAVTIACAACGEGARLYIDGARHATRPSPQGLEATLPPGRHHWQLTRGLPVPLPPTILRTENSAGKARLLWTAAAGAEKYRLELSEDGARTWKPIGETTETSYSLSALRDGAKYHVRLTALNAAQSSAPGPEYPVYATNAAPHHPDGLRLAITSGKASLTWGEVLGANEYRLYRRAPGAPGYQLVYQGTARAFSETLAGLRPAYDRPGVAAAALRNPANSTVTVYEYAVSAANGNGEGQRSAAVSTDPANWVNWDPRPGEPFRRRYTYNTDNYLRLGSEGDYTRYYPK